MPAYLYAPSGHCCELPPRPAEDDPFNILDAKRNEDLRTRDEILAEAAKPTAEMHLMGFLLRLISPKNLAAYILARILA